MEEVNTARRVEISSPKRASLQIWLLSFGHVNTVKVEASLGHTNRIDQMTSLPVNHLFRIEQDAGFRLRTAGNSRTEAKPCTGDKPKLSGRCRRRVKMSGWYSRE